MTPLLLVETACDWVLHWVPLPLGSYLCIQLLFPPPTNIGTHMMSHFLILNFYEPAWDIKYIFGMTVRALVNIWHQMIKVWAERKRERKEHQADTKDLTSSSKFSACCVLTLRAREHKYDVGNPDPFRRGIMWGRFLPTSVWIIPLATVTLVVGARPLPW